MRPDFLSGQIVVVEDNEEVNEILAHMLQSMSKNVEIICFKNGKDALSYLLENQHCVCGIISDLMMSEMDGIDFLASLRKDTRTRDVPFLFLSGAEPSVFSNLLKGYSFSGFIPKPVEPRMLKSLIEFNFRSVGKADNAA